MIIYIYIYICCFLSNHLLRFVATIFGVFVGCFQILINKRRVKTCRDYPSGCSLAAGGLGWALGVTLDYLMHGSGKWGHISVVYSSVVGPKCPTLVRFHFKKKKKKKIRTCCLEITSVLVNSTCIEFLDYWWISGNSASTFLEYFS